MWLKEEGFKEVLRKWLEGIQDKEESARTLSMEEEEARNEAIEAYKKWVLLEEARGVDRAFQGLLANPGGWKPNIDGLIFERLEELDVEELEKPFSEEVFGALSGFCGEKASGPNGFSMAF
ncbi:hypothetical protein CK203_048179 [Vitis vinifera]|uniref:Uncharacterized protein n=1 Tax=Vitis vinifera TaxID=29760 RepID=A0A438H3B2_VITVI|nr:hypothetical protein CK203_048179 [Vitis vinifera]